jgi:hypothetical protein
MADARSNTEITTMRRVRIRYAIGLALSVILAATCMWADSARSDGIKVFEMTPNGTQAGGHPDVSINFEWDRQTNPCNCGDARTTTTHFPTGFIGNPTASPPCEIVEFSFGRCPASTQIGTFGFLGAYGPLYNITPHPDEPSLVGFWVPLISAPVFISLSGRTESDYGLDAETSPIYHPLSLTSFTVTLWGVPADPIHDTQRFVPPLQIFGACFAGQENCPPPEGSNPANVPPVPYLEAPTQCGVQLDSTLDILFYTGDLLHATDPWPSTTGCEQLTFNPSLTAQPTTRDTDSPSGVDVVLSVPQEQSPSTPSPSEIRAVRTVLPEGFSLNPNAADGKQSCSDVETAIGTRHGATCPEFSKVGTLTLDSSALPQPIPGAIYIGEPKPGDRYRLLLSADGFGTHIKLLGSVRPDPISGRLVVAFDELPQSPLTEFAMHFFGSERGILATPTHCGSYPVVSEFVPWDEQLPVQHSTSSFTVDAGGNGGSCPATPRPFDPTLRAGSTNPSAGKFTPVSVEIERRDGDQFLSGLQVSTPPGLLASLRGVSYCPEQALQQIAASYSGAAELSNPLCPASSRIGTSIAGAGAGSRPVFLPGKVYLGGPYKGAPLSLAVVTPAVSGPYDLGNVLVRGAIHVDPLTTQVTVVSDPLPKIIGGVPLRVRDVKVDLDRPGFTLNPTNCEPFAIRSLLSGEEGGRVEPQVRYQATNCASMPYQPTTSLRLIGGLNRRGHPAIRGVFTPRPGDTNTKRVSVALPKGELLDNSHLDTVCTRGAFDARACPAGSLVGEAQVSSPLLDQPLAGKVYLRSSNHQLPDLVIDLQGQLDVQVIGRVDSVNGSLRTTFENLPDVPVGRFQVDFMGGNKGLIINSKALCGTTRRATVKALAQNNATFNAKPKVQFSCGAAGRHRSRHRNGRAGR